MAYSRLDVAGVHKALFWDFKDFQDRTIGIWENLAEVGRQSLLHRTDQLGLTNIVPAIESFAASFRCDTQHYKNNPWVAGYNPLNEPTDPKHTRLVAFYDRIEKAIRKEDDKHILFLE